MRRRLECMLTAALGVLCLAGCASDKGPASPAFDAGQTVERPGPEPLVRRMETSLAETLIERGIEDLVSAYPELASRLGEPNGNWNPPTRSVFSDEILIDLADRLATAVDPTQIPAPLRRDIAQIALGADIARRHRDLPERVDINPAVAPHIRLPRFLLTHHAIDSESAVRTWLQRLAAIDEQTRALIDHAASTETRLVGSATISRQCRTLNEDLQDTGDHFLVSEFAVQAAPAGPRSAAQLDEMRNAAITTFDAACRELLAFARRGDSPIAEEPARYRAALTRATSLDLDPQSLHARALDVLDGLDVSLPHAPGTPSGQQLLDQASSIVFDVEGELAALTSVAPAVDLDLALIRAPFQTAAPAQYWRGNALGTCYLDPAIIAAFGIEATTRRCTLPGAHLLPRSRIATIVPVPAFEQGWALFSLTLLDTEPATLDLHIATAAVRAAIDTGIHTQGWGRQQAITFVETQLPLDSTFARHLVDRVIAVPGEGVAAFVGFQAFRDMEEDTRRRLGARFSTANFIDALIEEGPRPFDLLRAKVGGLDPEAD